MEKELNLATCYLYVTWLDLFRFFDTRILFIVYTSSKVCHSLRELILVVIKSLNWQHIHCEGRHPNPDIKTLFVDHVCQPQQDFSFAQSTESISLVRSVLKTGVFFRSFPLLLSNWFFYSWRSKRMNYFSFILLRMVPLVIAFSSHTMSSFNNFWQLDF